MTRSSRDTDRDWVRIAEDEPYFGVLSDPRFLAARLNAATREEFFASGQAYIDFVWRRLVPLWGERPVARALDFGCGVGRLLLPMARISAEAFGIDVAPRMRSLTMDNAVQSGIGNIHVCGAVSELPDGIGFDWINECFVFQHVHPSRGYALLRQLMQRLDQGGVFSLQFSIARDRKALPLATHRLELYRVEDDGIRTLSERADDAEVAMSMFDYDLNVLLAELYRCGVDDVDIHHGMDGGHYSVILFGKKSAIRQRRIRPGEQIGFSAGGEVDLLRHGFAAPEAWGVWTVGERAVLELPIDAEGPIVLRFAGSGFAPSGKDHQPVSVFVNGRLKATWRAVPDKLQDYDVALDKDDYGHASVEIVLAIGAPISPAETGTGNDFRKLGFGLHTITVMRRRR